MNDPVRRGLRTLMQSSFIGAIIAMLAAFGLISWNETQTVLVMGVATPIVSFIQNALEDNTSFPALLKSPASSGENPVPAP